MIKNALQRIKKYETKFERFAQEKDLLLCQRKATFNKMFQESRIGIFGIQRGMPIPYPWANYGFAQLIFKLQQIEEAAEKAIKEKGYIKRNLGGLMEE